MSFDSNNRPPEGEHLSSESLQRYRDGTLGAAELLAVDDHLTACSLCREQLASAAHFKAAATLLDFTPRPEPAHLTYDQLAGYVDDTLPVSARRRAQAHLEQCSSCLIEANDLRAVKTQLELAAQHEAQAGLAAKPSLSAKLAALVQPRRAWLPLQSILAAGLTALVLFGMQIKPLQYRVAEQQNSLAARQDELAQERADRQALAKRNAALQQERQRIARQKDGAVTRSEQDRRTLKSENAALAAQRQQLEQQNAALQAREGTGAGETGVGESPSGQAGTANAGTSSGESGNSGSQKGAGNGTTSGSNSGRGHSGTPKLPPPATTSSDAKQVEDALTALVVSRAGELKKLSGEAPIPRGAKFKFKVVSPVGTVVRSTQPEFRWEAVPNATKYRLELYDETDGAGEEPLPIETPGLSWRPAPGQLLPGHRYRWTVLAYQKRRLLGQAPQSPDAEARFQVLAAAEAQALETQLKALDKPDKPSLARAMLLAQHGLLDEAQAQFQSLLRDNPRSPLLQKLLRNLRALRAPSAHKAGRNQSLTKEEQ